MSAQTTINVRLPEALKQHGAQVLERNGISTTEAIRKLFEHLELTQEVPEWMVDPQADDVYDKRRRLLRALPAIESDVVSPDARDAWRDHLIQKHAPELAGDAM